MAGAHHESDSYRSVDITRALASRPGRRRDETSAVLALAQSIAAKPEDSLQLLARFAMAQTGAHAAGISVTSTEGGEEVFRWRAAVGLFEPHLGATLPRWFSPCGDVLRIDGPLLMREPVAHYPYVATLGVPIQEVLLSPIRRDGEPVGTVWVTSRDASKLFDAEDARVLGVLCDFVSDTTDLLDRLSFGVTQ